MVYDQSLAVIQLLLAIAYLGHVVFFFLVKGSCCVFFFFWSKGSCCVECVFRHLMLCAAVPSWPASCSGPGPFINDISDF